MQPKLGLEREVLLRFQRQGVEAPEVVGGLFEPGGDLFQACEQEPDGVDPVVAAVERGPVGRGWLPGGLGVASGASSSSWFRSWSRG